MSLELANDTSRPMMPMPSPGAVWPGDGEVALHRDGGGERDVAADVEDDDPVRGADRVAERAGAAVGQIGHVVDGRPARRSRPRTRPRRGTPSPVRRRRPRRRWPDARRLRPRRCRRRCRLDHRCPRRHLRPMGYHLGRSRRPRRPGCRPRPSRRYQLTGRRSPRASSRRFRSHRLPSTRRPRNRRRRPTGPATRASSPGSTTFGETRMTGAAPSPPTSSLLSCGASRRTPGAKGRADESAVAVPRAFGGSIIPRFRSRDGTKNPCGCAPIRSPNRRADGIFPINPGFQ